MDPHSPPATGSLVEGLSAFVRHAELVWWLAAVLAIAASVVIVRASLGWLRALRAIWTRRQLGPVERDLRSVAGREVTLCGTLIAGPEPHALHPEGTVVRSDAPGFVRSDRRWMVSGKTAIELSGPISIRVGSEERWFAEQLLRVGERVVARGRAVRSKSAAADVPNAFRASASGLRLEATPRCHLPLAFTGRPKRTGGLKFDTFVGGALGAVLWLSGSAFASNAAVASARSSFGPLTSTEMLGASAPLRPGSALGAMVPAHHSSDARYISFAGLEMARSGDCRLTRRALMDAGRVSLVADLMPQCGSPEAIRDAARAYLSLGRFDDAHRMVLRAPAARASGPIEDELRLDVQAHVLSEHIEDARLAIVDARPRLGPARQAPWVCMAGALDVRAGRTERGRRLLERGHHGAAEALCAVLLADATEGQERLEALSSVRHHRGWAIVVSALSTEVDVVSVRPRELWTPVHDGRLVFGDPLHAPVHPGWLHGAHRALASQPDSTPVMEWERASLAAELAFYAAATGDIELARRLAEDARQAGAVASESPLLQVMWIRDDDEARLAWLSAAIEVRAGDLEAARGWLVRGSRDVFGADDGAGRELENLIRQLERPAGLDLMEGDGDGIALTRQWKYTGHQVSERGLAMTSRRVARYPQDLSQAIARGLGRNPISLLSPLRLVDLAAHWHNRELAARALGDEDGAVEHAARAERFRTVLQRRDHALILEVLSSI